MYNAIKRHRLQEADGSMESRRYLGGGQATNTSMQQPRQFTTQNQNQMQSYPRNYSQSPNPAWNQEQYQDPSNSFSSLLSFLNQRQLPSNYMNYANNIRNNAPKYNNMNPTGQLYYDTMYGPYSQPGQANTAQFGTNQRPNAQQIALTQFTPTLDTFNNTNAPADPMPWQNPATTLPTFTDPGQAAGWRRDQGLPALPIQQGF